MLAPFKEQGGRAFNKQSLYDAVNYLLGTRLKADQIGLLPALLQSACALIAAAMRPRSFPDLANAFLFAMLGLVTFSAFQSPQFVLWTLPLVAFSDQRSMLIAAIALCWLTYLYFPIGFDLARRQAPSKAVVVAVAGLHLLMMWLTLKRWYLAR